VEGLNGDVDLVGREVRDHCSQNKQKERTFTVQSPMHTQAFKHWFTEELNQAKNFVW
jgi:hypothetical protein